MRVFVPLLLYLLAAVSPAGAARPDHGSGLSEDFRKNGGLVIYRQAFYLNREPPLSSPVAFPSAASPTARPDRTGAGPSVLLALTLVPPADSYLYGSESEEGLPTSVQASVQAAAAFPMRGPRPSIPAPGRAGLSGTADEESLPVRAPPATPKKETRFASLRFPGMEGDNPPVYAGPVTFWTQFPAPEGLGGSSLRVNISGLLCSERNCTPVSVSLNLDFSARDVSMLPRAEDEAWLEDFEAGESVLIPPPSGTLHTTADPAFAGGSDLGAFVAPGGTTEGATAGGRFASLQPVPFRTETEITSLGEALFFGLLAGLILNLMPCVLPVISLKFSALLAVSAMDDKKERSRAFREHCLLFAAGILTWFCVLALLFGGAGRLWGDLFQQPAVPAALGLILFLLALSLFGVFYLPVLNLRVGGEGHPRRQAFVGGMLATLLATPCSGPLLGGVLAWAVNRPLSLLVPAVFSVGLGMALPYLLLSLRPGLVHLLPRPGPWTLRLEQLLGFLLMGSVVYISTLLPEHWVAPFLYNLLAVAAAAWLWGSIGHLRAGRVRRIAARGSACALLILSIVWGLNSLAPDRTWEKFDADRFLAALGKDPMLLDFTADWCPNCKALEYATLSPGRMEDLRKRYNVRTIKVDLTRDAEAGNELLKALHSGSIPVIALFPAGEKAARPVVLRDLVTPGQLGEAARAVFAE
ncbi:MAG: thioredoxin family protein [Desulfovibrio sp.]|jgi:thiol:disulfide interchange protein DsbD|nr:thioredoxin family protein [Desulfovibrio sp.]